MERGVLLYIAKRRNEGFSYVTAAHELRKFARYVGDIELHQVRTEQIVGFLSLGQLKTSTWRGKHSVLRRFFRHWFLLGVSSEVHMPPTRRSARQDFTPYVFSFSEVSTLINATTEIRMYPHARIRAETLRAVLLFLYGTGARLNETLALRNSDVDLGRRTVTFCWTRPGAARVIPIGMELHRILTKFREWKLSADEPDVFFFSRRNGQQIARDMIYERFRQILTCTGLQRRGGGSCLPRLSDLRVTFASHQLTRWIRDGRDLNRLMPALSAFLGYTSLELSQNLLDLTPERFKGELDRLSPKKGSSWTADEGLLRTLGKI